MAKPKNTALVFQNWQVEEKLGGTKRYTEYRVKHNLLGKSGGMARLKVYNTDPYQDKAARDEEFKVISNAYRSVAHMPSHANILSVKDLIVSEDREYVALVTEDIPAQVLRLYINKQSMALTFDQKLQVMKDVLTALDHAHHHEVIHRNLTPDAILLTQSGTARLTDFDFARVGKDRVSTIADQIVDDLDPLYQAPECYKDPRQASIASDLYAAGLVFYELLTGEKPFENLDQMMDADGKFPMKPSEHKQRLPEGMDEWLQQFCEFDPEDRHASAAIARKALDDLILPEGKEGPENKDPTKAQIKLPQEDLKDLPQDFILADRFRIQEKLGKGGFAATYKVFDVLGDITRVMKLVTHDHRSVYERMRKEYKVLVNMPEHPHVVKVIWADRLADANQTPYIVFEYIKGLDVSDLNDTGALSLEDSVRIVRETAKGLSHLHKYGIYHQDVKPNNLLWTDKGVCIIDFNVSVTERDMEQGGGGTRRYVPPDWDFLSEPISDDRIDRDLYALGISFYECLTGNGYPFDTPNPIVNAQPKDPRSLKGCADLSEPLVKILLKMISPHRKERFTSAEAFLRALGEVKIYRVPLSEDKHSTDSKAAKKPVGKPTKANTNPFVEHLLTLYSQSQVSNAGTRGLDEIGKVTYAPTYLDERLQPALLKGEFGLVIISGNAGDGKTAFIQQFEDFAKSKGATIKRGANGAVFELKGYTYQSNYDGSQDEGDERNDMVLRKFFAPFTGSDKSQWPKKQTRLIAINEGRLVDFFMEHENEYPMLAQEIKLGLDGALPHDGIAVINLNLRSVVASDEDGLSIMEHLLDGMTNYGHWQACEKCDLKLKCYAYHNACTFRDAKAGPKTTERLKTLYAITHFRGRLHITMRDLRSALAYMLVGTLDCAGIHELYLSSSPDNANRILDSFYFNSWLGGSAGSNDRLISLLREIDVAEVSNPVLDRKLGFFNPKILSANRFSFAGRSGYDDDLMESLFEKLPQERSQKQGSARIPKYRNYLSHLRRRHFFERRDEDWKEMLPYNSVDTFMEIINHPGEKRDSAISELLQAVNRGEGLCDAERLGNQLALRVHQVERGTIHSYRIFKGEFFKLSTDRSDIEHPFLERMPQTLVLTYDSGDGQKASLRINLDIYEILMRLNNGYRPSVEVQEGFYLSLTVFKNVLSAAPYQETLLTDSDLGFFRIRRDAQGVLHMEKLNWEAEA